MDKRVIAVILFSCLLPPLFSGCLGGDTDGNSLPVVLISYPLDDATVFGLVMISGTAFDPDGNKTLQRVEVKIDDNEWNVADGSTKWSFDWGAYEVDDGLYTIRARAWDGLDYSEVKEAKIRVENPVSVETGEHKWAVFVAASNFPEENESKLGNGGLYLAEEMTEYFINNYGYSTDNIFILFDDGWIRSDDGYGRRIQTLQQRRHDYDVTYAGATLKNVETVIRYVIEESNKYDDSEVFLWFFSHGCGDENNPVTGGKLLENSEIFLWDSTIKDIELGEMLTGLQSEKTCVIVDACFSGGFADKTILNLPTLFLTKSDIARSGRVVITGASKFRLGYASTEFGPLFSLLWFNGLKTGDADGFRPGIIERGRPTILSMFKDGDVSVEEAFYYARYKLRTEVELKDYKRMEPQINDQYPNRGVLRSQKGMLLG